MSRGSLQRAVTDDALLSIAVASLRCVRCLVDTQLPGSTVIGDARTADYGRAPVQPNGLRPSDFGLLDRICGKLASCRLVSGPSRHKPGNLSSCELVVGRCGQYGIRARSRWTDD